MQTRDEVRAALHEPLAPIQPKTPADALALETWQKLQRAVRLARGEAKVAAKKKLSRWLHGQIAAQVPDPPEPRRPYYWEG